jgi:hypothetical protein
LLSDLYDCPNKYDRALKKNSYKIREPSLNIFAASSLSWFNDVISGSDLEGGFYSRFLYVPALHRVKAPVAWPESIDGEKVNKLIKNLASIINCIAGYTPPVIYKPDSIKEQFIEYFYESQAVLDQIEIEYLRAYLDRLDKYLIKFCILYDISTCHEESIKSKEINPLSFDYAVNLVRYLRKLLLNLFKYEIRDCEGWYPKAKQSILKRLRQNNGHYPYRRLQQNSHLVSREFKEVIHSLEEEGLIYIDTEATPKTVIMT